MKKLFLHFIISLIMSIVLVGCNIDNSNDNYYFPPYTTGWYWQPNQTNGNGQNLIGGPVNNYSASTRAYSIQTSDVISDYSDFSLFGWTPDSVIMNNYRGTINNQVYTWGYDSDKKYFDNNVSDYSFIGIIPYNSNLTINEDKSINVSLQDFTTEGVDPNNEKYNKEFITARANAVKGSYQNGATLNFYHQNSIIRIKFETTDGNNLEIIDFTPYTPGTPYQPAVPISTTTLSEKRKMFDLMAEGEAVGYPFNTFQETNGGKYTGQKGNFFNIHPNTYLTNERLAELMPLVNAQFEYLNEEGTDISNVNWIYGADRKDKVFIKFADGVSASDFIAGNDVFWNNLTNDEKSSLQNYRDSGCRAIRINQLDNGDYFVWGESYGTYMNTTSRNFTILTGGTPEVPATPAVGKQGIVILPATSTNQTGTDAVLSTFPETVTANVSMNTITYTETSTQQEIIFTKAGIVNYSVYSPTNWYTFPVIHENKFGFTIKFSYVLNGVTRYDARVFVKKEQCNWQPGKWYDYVITVKTTQHGKADPTEADETDPKIEEIYPININTTINQYSSGEIYKFSI